MNASHPESLLHRFARIIWDPKQQIHASMQGKSSSFNDIFWVLLLSFTLARPYEIASAVAKWPLAKSLTLQRTIQNAISYGAWTAVILAAIGYFLHLRFTKKFPDFTFDKAAGLVALLWVPHLLLLAISAFFALVFGNQLMVLHRPLAAAWEHGWRWLFVVKFFISYGWSLSLMLYTVHLLRKSPQTSDVAVQADAPQETQTQAPQKPRTWKTAILILLYLSATVAMGFHISKDWKWLRPRQAGEKAPSFSMAVLANSSQEKFSLQQLRGQVVVLDFWATWCGPCVQTMPNLQLIHNNYKRHGLAVLAVNQEPDNTDNVIQFIADHKYTFPVVLDQGQVARSYRVDTLPTTVIIDRSGEIAFVHLGALNREDLKLAVKHVLRTSPPTKPTQ